MTLGLLVAGGTILYKHLVHPNYARIGSLLGWGPNGSQIVQSAYKWSQKRGLPFPWVLATIIVESGGNPRSTGDANGESKGLMQVNTVANAAVLRQYGYGPSDMYDIDHGIEIGTLLMKQFYDKVKQHGAARVRTPIDETLRLSYKGPEPVYNALDRGQEPSSLLVRASGHRELARGDAESCISRRRYERGACQTTVRVSSAALTAGGWLV